MKHDGNYPRTTWTYDARGLLVGVCRSNADGILLECVTLTYDDAGRPLAEDTDAGKITTWTYDQLGQLLTE